MTYLRIRDWLIHFENNRTRDLKSMSWVPVPNKHDGDGYTVLVNHKNGAAHLGAWLAILQVASKCEERGTLLRSNGLPHDSDTFERITGIKAAIFEEVIPRLLDKEIGWLEAVGIDGVTEIPQEGAGIPQEGAVETQASALEGKGKKEQKEGNGKEDYAGHIERWNTLAKKHGLQSLRGINAARRTHFDARLKENPDFWEVLESEIPLLNPFARGVNDSGWKVSFDYCVESQAKFDKLAEGAWRDNGASDIKPAKPQSFYEINKQLEALNSIWTQNSTNPEWVASDEGRKTRAMRKKLTADLAFMEKK